MDNYSDKIDKSFCEFYKEILNSCDQNEIKLFCSATDINTDIKRFKFVSEFKTIKERTFNLDNVSCKNSEAAIELKIQGNAAFQANNWTLALDIYNEALMTTPTANVEDIAIILANRSAVLYHLKQYKLAIEDIKTAAIKYPKDKMYKIKERLAKCYLSIGDFPNSLNAFKEMIHCLYESSLPNDKRLKCEKEAQTMVRNLQAKIEPIDTSLPKLSIKKYTNDAVVPYLSASVGFGYNLSDGYYAKANNDIKIGDSILVEKPHCAVLLAKYTKTHCHHCFLRTIAPLVCPYCPNVVFCSSECKDIALSTYHAYECKILPLILGYGFPNKFHMALRTISQKPLQYFIKIKDQLTDNLKFEDTLKLLPDDYRTVFTLVRHENIREPSHFLHDSIIANVLVSFLRNVNYFASVINNDIQFKELYSFIGGLILRNLQILQYNVHVVWELRSLKGHRKTIRLGDACYPTLARFNHSCNPSILKYFKGTSVYVHATTNIKPGEVIYENYGPVYNLNPYVERQQKLQRLYHFSCTCKPCTELWPMRVDMSLDDTKLKFKCDGGNKNCKNIIIISSDLINFMVKCNKCNQITNISKSLKAVQIKETLQKVANQLFERSEYQRAAERYCEILKIIEDFFVLPCIDYYSAQKLYNECLMEYGSKNVYFKDA